MSLFKMRHCLDLSSWTVEQYLFFFTKIQALKAKGFSALPNQTSNRPVGLIFQEPSTRTRISFEKAANHMGAKSYVLEQSSSMCKGESVADTVATLAAMGIEDFVIRSIGDDVFEIAKTYERGFLINAGSGMSHHPTQGLIDAFTIWEKLGRLDDRVQVTLVGDLVHSRVARSNMQWLQTFGIEPVVCGPLAWIKDFAGERHVVEENFDRGIASADVFMFHRVQKERFSEAEGFDQDAFVQQYGMNAQRISQAKSDVIVMHPGPVNRGIEISDEVASCQQAMMSTQVENGVWVRIGLMQMLRGKEL